MRYHYTFFRIAKNLKIDSSKCWCGCGATCNAYIFGGKCQTIQPLLKIVWLFLIKLNIDPAIFYLDIYLNYENICPPNSLYKNIHNSQKPKANALSIGEWLNKLWYLHTVDYYSAVKRNNSLVRISSYETSKYVLFLFSLLSTTKAPGYYA